MSQSILKTFMAAMFIMAFATTSFGEEPELAGIKCLIDGDAQVSSDATAQYKEGTVYFCCDKCAVKFKSEMKDKDGENADLATKANHQLVLTGQYVQKACPLSGKPVDKTKTVDVGGVTVGLCCDGCVKKINKAEGLKAKAQLVFADKPFEKGFEPKKEKSGAINLENVKCLVKPTKDVSPDISSDYHGHKVFFCCKGCQKKFDKDPSAYTTQANFQLVASGQVKQVACPFSGEPVADAQSSEVNGVTVKFCCKNCKAKFDKADEKQQMEYAFGDKGFAKAFSDKK